METREPLIYIVLRWLIGMFFVIAGVVKWVDPSSFQQTVLAYGVVGYPVSFVVAHFLPSFECMLGIGLILRRASIPVLLMMAVLLVIFVMLLSWTWWKGIDVNCGCLGPIDWVEGQPAAIGRDLILLAGIGALYRRERRQVSYGV